MFHQFYPVVCIDNSISLINIIKTFKARSDANECVLFYNVCIPYFIVIYLHFTNTTPQNIIMFI